MNLARHRIGGSPSLRRTESELSGLCVHLRGIGVTSTVATIPLVRQSRREPLARQP